MKIKKLLIPAFLEEAKMYLHENITIIGGGTFLHLGYKDSEIETAMSLAKLNLNFINYKENYIEIGATTTLHKIEMEKRLNEIYSDIFKKAFSHIVGVQFRNVATIGGSVAARLGYSEPISILLALNSSIELHDSTKVSLEDYLSTTSYKKNLITKIIIPVNSFKISYFAVRNTQTDIPSLIIVVSKDKNNKFKIVIGARPAIAKIAYKASEFISLEKAITTSSIEKVIQYILEEIEFGNDIRANKEYRKNVVKSIIPQLISEVQK